MTYWIPICLAVFGLYVSQGFEHAEASDNAIHSLPDRMARLTTSPVRSSSYLLTEIDNGGPAENQEPDSGREADTPSAPSEKFPKSDKAPRSRSVPLKPMPPSEEIKADQAVDFPYNI